MAAQRGRGGGDTTAVMTQMAGGMRADGNPDAVENPKQHGHGGDVEGSRDAVMVEHGRSVAGLASWTSGYDWGMWMSGYECCLVACRGPPIRASAGLGSQRPDG